MPTKPLYVETKSLRVQLLMQPNLHEALMCRAKAEGTSLNELVHGMLSVLQEHGMILVALVGLGIVALAVRQLALWAPWLRLAVACAGGFALYGAVLYLLRERETRHVVDMAIGAIRRRIKSRRDTLLLGVVTCKHPKL